MEFLIPLILGAIISTLFYKLAERKNRRGWVWGTLTGISITAFIFSAMFIPSCVRNDSTEIIIAAVFAYGSLGLFAISAIVLAFLSPICVKCNKKLTRKQWKNNECPQCGVL